MRQASIALAFALASCAAPVGTLPRDADVWWFTVSRDGSTWAFAERRGSNAWLVAGDRRYGPHP